MMATVGLVSQDTAKVFWFRVMSLGRRSMKPLLDVELSSPRIASGNEIRIFSESSRVPLETPASNSSLPAVASSPLFLDSGLGRR